jgi:hypothetical protein
MKPNYGDTFLWGGVTAEYAPSRCPNGIPFGKETLEQLTHPKEIIQQLVKNLKDSFGVDLF